MTTTPLRIVRSTDTPQQIGAQVARLVRQARRAPAPVPAVPWQRHLLFQEPVYADGPYDRSDEDDDSGD